MLIAAKNAARSEQSSNFVKERKNKGSSRNHCSEYDPSPLAVWSSGNGVSSGSARSGPRHLAGDSESEEDGDLRFSAVFAQCAAGHGEEPVNSKYEDDKSTAPADPDKQMQRGVLLK